MEAASPERGLQGTTEHSLRFGRPLDDLREVYLGLLGYLEGDFELSYAPIPFDPALKRLFTSKDVFSDGREAAGRRPGTDCRTDFEPILVPSPSMLLSTADSPLSRLPKTDLSVPEDTHLLRLRPSTHRRLRRTPSLTDTASLSPELEAVLVQMFTQKTLRRFPRLNRFDYAVLSSVLTKVSGGRVRVRDAEGLRRHCPSIRTIHKPERQLREQYKKYAFRMAIFIMKMRFDYEESLGVSGAPGGSADARAAFDRRFRDFLASSFARKNQRLDGAEFETRFYQGVFSDVLAADPQAVVTDFVCPTSSRPSLDRALQGRHRKLPSRFCTINAQYFQTVFSSRKFSELFRDVLSRYFDQFALCQVRHKCEGLVRGWQALFVRRRAAEPPLTTLRRILEQIERARIKLAWPLHKVRMAKAILRREARAAVRRLRN